MVAAGSGLSPDEAYYRVWAHALAPGYLDHPPMVALAIRAGTAVAGETALGVRLLGPIATLAGSLLLVQAGRDLLDLSDERAWLAALLFNATLMVGVGAVVMTPDTPVVLFWGVTLFCLGRALRTGRAGWMAAAGIALGLGFCSKYTAVLLAPAVGIWLVATPRTRGLLRTRGTIAAIVLGLAIASPVIWWNATHHFASFAKQGGREDVAHLGRAPRYLSELVAGQFGLLTPLVAILAVRGSVAAGRRAWRGEPGPLLVTLATVVPGIVFVAHAFGDRVQANWPCVLVPSLALAASSVGRDRGPIVSRFGGAIPAVILGLAVTGCVYAQATLRPFDLPPRLDVTAARLDGWGRLAGDVRQLDAPLGLSVASPDYGLASELAWNDAGQAVAGVDEARWRLFRLPPALRSGVPVLLVRRLGRGDPGHGDPGREGPGHDGSGHDGSGRGGSGHDELWRGHAARPGGDAGAWRSLRRLAIVSRRAGSRVVERDEVLIAVPEDPPGPSAWLPVRTRAVPTRAVRTTVVPTMAGGR